MNADETVRALRHDASTHVSFIWSQDILDMAKHSGEAADLIESLQAQHASSEIPCCECGGEVVEFTVPNDIWNSVMRPDGHETDREYLCFDCWYKALRQWMHGMQRREQAAVEDLRKLDCREPFGGKHCTHKSGCYEENRKIGGNYPECGGCTEWEWRGPQDEKGEAT